MKAFGITTNEHGRYVMASLSGDRKRARIAINRWSIGDKLRQMRLLHHGVYCGLPSLWKSAMSDTPKDILAGGASNLDFTPYTDRMIASMHSDNLSDNLTALVPEDAYLCTVPLFCQNAAVRSFICAHAMTAEHDRPAYFKIGIIIDAALVSVHSMAPGNADALESHLARIQRYFTRAFPGIPFPGHAYTLGIDHAIPSNYFSFHPVKASIGKRNVRETDEIMALGCALIQRTGRVPVFPASHGDAFRRFRAAARVVSAALILFAACTAVAPVIANYFLERKIKSYESRMRSIIVNDPRIKAAMTRNQSLGTSIIQLSAKAGEQTQWGKFLQSLGAMRPEGLFFEKLGSEPIGASAGAVRIAIAGSAQSETMVTDLIAQMQKTGFISNLSLTSMEKNKSKPAICDFKIICTLKILTQ